MVLLIIIPFLNGYFIGNIPNIFRQTHIENTIYRSFDVGETPGFTWKKISAPCHVFKLLNHPTPGHELENLLMLSREWMGCWGLLG